MGVLHQCPEVKKYLFSLYNCQYGDFFQCLGKVEKLFKEDRYLAPHYAYYVREMKIKAYAQASYEAMKEQYEGLQMQFNSLKDQVDSQVSPEESGHCERRYLQDGT